jgi:SpoVK/Ycf46/Vps4 family AAA+-type ATPase
MPDEHPSIQSLRAALEVSPDNVPLREHLAETLMQHGLAEEAEGEYRTALSQAPRNVNLKVGLARAFAQQGKDSHAMVVVEELVKSPNTPAAAFLLHSRLLLRCGDVGFAVTEYKAAVDADESLRDRDLEETLGIDADDDNAEVVDGRLRAGWGENGPSEASFTIERPSINFGDVGGMHDLKEEIRMKIIYPLEHEEMFKAYGKTVGGGVLMYGPPGCGKTHLARATAGEIKAGFLSIGINDVLEMWIGSSERNLHELFESARRNRPCVLFFDEVDALGASRTDMKGSAGRHLINQFLAELDGVNSSNDGVLILAATNAPWHMDSAFRRPGRFDRILFVPPPDESARAEVLRILCHGKPAADIDHAAVAKKARDFSGADLMAVVDQASEAKLAAAMKSGVPEPLRTKDLTAAVKKVKPSTKDWFATARNYALYSNQGGTYDDILKYLKLQ